MFSGLSIGKFKKVSPKKRKRKKKAHFVCRRALSLSGRFVRLISKFLPPRKIYRYFLLKKTIRCAKMFYIKKSIPDKFAKYTDDAFEYYKAHKKTIDKIILEKRKGYGDSPY